MPVRPPESAYEASATALTLEGAQMDSGRPGRTRVSTTGAFPGLCCGSGGSTAV